MKETVEPRNFNWTEKSKTLSGCVVAFIEQKPRLLLS